MNIVRLGLLATVLAGGLMLAGCGASRQDAPATEETQMQSAPVQTAPADSAQADTQSE